jgi:hypothetical protein
MGRYLFVPEDLPPDQPALVEGGGEGSAGGRLGGRGAGWDLGLAVQPLPPLPSVSLVIGGAAPQPRLQHQGPPISIPAALLRPAAAQALNVCSLGGGTARPTAFSLSRLMS